MRDAWIPIAIVLLALGSPAVLAQKAVDFVQKEEALASAKRAFDEAQKSIRAAYDAMEQALVAARGEQGVTWTAELRRVLEPTASGATAVIAKRGSRAQVQAVFKREVPVALKKIENRSLAAFEPVLAARLQAVADKVELNAAQMDAGNLAALALGDLLGNRPFHDFWNESFADSAPASDTYRKAFDGLDKAKWDLDVAKDPVLQYQRGAPAGFARVPAGSYFELGSAGFASSGARKGKKPVTLAKDVYLGLREVTHAEFFDWWKTLDVELKKKHLPIDQNSQPLWPTPEGADGPTVTDEISQRPVSGITLTTAFAYAAGRGARLPSEAEWCAAAGGRDGRAYPWGETWQPDQANDAERKVNDTLPVGSLAGRGPFGHVDLAGNVAEWTATYESGKPVEWAKLEDANVVIRGGSYARAKEDVSNGWVWYGRAVFDRQKDVGFRIAMDAPKK